jgi:hypothetical protein
MNFILNLMNRKTDNRPTPAPAGTGATPKTLREFEAELQGVPNT